MADANLERQFTGQVHLLDNNCKIHLSCSGVVYKGLVKFSSNKIVNCADNDTEAIGWALETTGSSATSVLVQLYPGIVAEVKYTGSPSAVIGKWVSITDYETIDIADTSNDLFAMVLDYNATTSTALVYIPAARLTLTN